MTPADMIRTGRTTLGIELGSTRIKACLVGADPTQVLATGSSEWENEFVDRLWTYSLEAVWAGLQDAYANLVTQVEQTYQCKPETFAAMGVSAMMHGYLAFDSADNLLVPFRTWRNTNTGKAAAELTDLFGVNIPLRWSIAHLHQAILDNEAHVADLHFITSLAGYVHWQLTGHKIVGVGDASGIFPIDSTTRDYDTELIDRFDRHAGARLPSASVHALLPKAMPAGERGGTLTEAGASLLDPSGLLRPGIPLCPPEGDAGTGMVATNAVTARTGNISAGTSIFAMVVLDRPVHGVHPEIDLVTTPVGDAVALVHCNNGASELATWIQLFKTFGRLAGFESDDDAVFDLLFTEALTGEEDAGGLLAYNYLAGEPITGLNEGRPLFVRTPESRFTLANFMRSQLYGVFGTLSLGMRVLESEGVSIDRMFAHGGMFRTAGVAQRLLAGALNVPVAVGDTASEGGAWGIAVLSAYLRHAGSMSLSAYLDNVVFANADISVSAPVPRDVAGYNAYLGRYEAGLAIQAAAVDSL